MDKDIEELVNHLRTLANEIERRGIIRESIHVSGQDEVIQTPNLVTGVMEARRGPKIRRSYSFAWADIEPARESEGERSIWL